MPWGRLNDKANGDAKLLALSDAGWRMWGCGLIFCQNNLTDGFIPTHAIETFGVRARSKSAVAEELCTALVPGKGPLWHRVEGGFRVHDYLDWNDSRADVLADRERGKTRQKSFRDRNRNGVSNALRDALGDAGQTGDPRTTTTPSEERGRSRSLWTSSTATEAETLTAPERRSRLTADDIVSLWNQLVSTPIPQVTKLTADRRSKIEARIRAYPDDGTWRDVITWVNTQDWCRAPGRGDHPNWTASLDWLCKNDGTIAKCLERLAAEKAQGRRQADHSNRGSAPVNTEYTPAMLKRIQNAGVK